MEYFSSHCFHCNKTATEEIKSHGLCGNNISSSCFSSLLQINTQNHLYVYHLNLVRMAQQIKFHGHQVKTSQNKIFSTSLKIQQPQSDFSAPSSINNQLFAFFIKPYTLWGGEGKHFCQYTHCSGSIYKSYGNKWTRFGNNFFMYYRMTWHISIALIWNINV